jgi:hypothetical protein
VKFHEPAIIILLSILPAQHLACSASCLLSILLAQHFPAQHFASSAPGERCKIGLMLTHTWIADVPKFA